jgi:hypothetical protein
MSGSANPLQRYMPKVLDCLRQRLFSSWPSALATLGILYLGLKFVPPLLDWALVRAVWSPQHATMCRAPGHGACWAFVADKYRFILFEPSASNSGGPQPWFGLMLNCVWRPGQRSKFKVQVNSARSTCSSTLAW